MHKLIVEYAVFGLDVLRRRGFILLALVMAAVAIAFVAVKLSPKTYASSSLILLQAANRSAADTATAAAAYSRERVSLQVAALNSWLKSDEVLADLIPRLYENGTPTDRSQFGNLASVIRSSLSLQLIGSTTLEVRLEGTSPNGLARQLEIIVARILEGLTGSDRSILNSSQFLAMQARDEVRAALNKLMVRIDQLGFRDRDKVLRQLAATSGEQVFLQSSRRPDADGGEPKSAADANAARDELLHSAHLQELRRLHDGYVRAAARANSYSIDERMQRSNWVSIFDSPENLLIIGRPKDPLYGESSVKKLALLGILLSFVIGCGLIFLLETMAARPRLTTDFEDAVGVPVFARLCAIPAANSRGGT